MFKFLLLVFNVIFAFVATFLLHGFEPELIPFPLSHPLVFSYVLPFLIGLVIPVILLLQKRIPLLEMLTLSLTTSLIVGTLFIGAALQFRNF